MRVGLRYWMRALLRRERFETDLDEELRYHLAREIERLRAGGMPLDEAKRTARLGFGNVAVLKEESRDARGTRFIEELVADIEYALRVLRRSPGFAAVAILTLAMGIGLTTAIVSVVSAVLVRPLAYPESDRLVMVLPSQRTDGPFTFATVTPGDFLEWRAQNATFSHLSGFTGSSFVLTGAGDPQRINGASVTSDFFSTLGVTPLPGRTFTADDMIEGRSQVVVLSGGLWRNRFAADPSVVGRRVTLDGAPYTGSCLRSLAFRRSCLIPASAPTACKCSWASPSSRATCRQEERRTWILWLRCGASRCCDVEGLEGAKPT